MKPFLESIIIEGGDGRRRHLEFQPGMNIITGAGSKGKSAVLRIVEYCLGSRTCNIPVGKVRDFGAWYFLVLNIGDQQVTVGRKAPSDAGAPSDIGYYMQGGRGALRTDMTQLHMGVNTACRLLGDALGFPSEKFQLGMDPLMHGRLQVPEILPLLVQPQDIVATQQLFAHVPSAGLRINLERWTQTIKIALGIIRPELLLLRERERELTRKRESLRRRQNEHRLRYVEACRHVEYLWQQAVAADFVPLGKTMSVDDICVGLEQMRDSSTHEMSVSAASAHTDSVIAELESRSRDLRKTLRQHTQEIRQIDRLRAASSDVAASLAMQSSRLRVVDILGPRTGERLSCPLCGHALGEEDEELLHRMQDHLGEESLFVDSIPPELDAAEAELRRGEQTVRRDLYATEMQLGALQGQDAAPTLTERRVRRERLIGALEHALRIVREVSVGGEFNELGPIDAELSDLKQQIQALETEKDEWEVRESLSSRMVSMATGLKRMKLEGDTLAFDRHFTTVVRGRAGRMHPLSTLGGAENYVMYHLCALLALHERFSKDSFVPRLLILDQPSQVYFPTDVGADDEDLEAVRAIYDLMFRVSADCENRFQTIVLDHADFSASDQRFKDAKRYDWHGDDGLIPDGW